MEKRITASLIYLMIVPAIVLGVLWFHFIAGHYTHATFLIIAAILTACTTDLCRIKREHAPEKSTIAYIRDEKLAIPCATLVLGIAAAIIQLVFFYFPNGIGSTKPVFGSTPADIPCGIAIAIFCAATTITSALTLYKRKYRAKQSN